MAGRPRLPWSLVTAAGAVAVIALVVLLVQSGKRSPEGWNRPLEPLGLVDEVTGTARALRGTAPRALARGQTVYTGESLETERGASLSLTTYPGEATISLGGQATLLLETPAEVRILRGRVQAKVPETVVQLFITPHGRIITRETTLSLEVGATGTRIDVSMGDARVEGPRGLRQVVDAGATLFLAAEPAPGRD